MRRRKPSLKRDSTSCAGSRESTTRPIRPAWSPTPTLQADLGHYSAAEKLYDESGKLLREQLGEQHPIYTTFLNNRAALYTALGNLTVAEADYRKALELKRKIYGPDALTVGRLAP